MTDSEADRKAALEAAEAKIDALWEEVRAKGVDMEGFIQAVIVAVGTMRARMRASGADVPPCKEAMRHVLH